MQGYNTFNQSRLKSLLGHAGDNTGKLGAGKRFFKPADKALPARCQSASRRYCAGSAPARTAFSL